MPDNGDKELVPLNGRHLPHGFPKDVVQRGLELMLESGSVHQAQLQLAREMLVGDKDAVIPAWTTMLGWARENKDVIERIHADRKRDMVALGYDASMASGQRMLAAIPNLPDSQIAVPHGIVWQRQTELIKEGPAVVQAIQLNVSAGGQAEANPWSKDKD